jgi:hypothetical protein
MKTRRANEICDTRIILTYGTAPVPYGTVPYDTIRHGMVRYRYGMIYDPASERESLSVSSTEYTGREDVTISLLCRCHRQTNERSRRLFSSPHACIIEIVYRDPDKH